MERFASWSWSKNPDDCKLWLHAPSPETRLVRCTLSPGPGFEESYRSFKCAPHQINAWKSLANTKQGKHSFSSKKEYSWLICIINTPNELFLNNVIWNPSPVQIRQLYQAHPLVKLPFWGNRPGQSASEWQRRWEPIKGPESRSRTVYAKLKSNREPETASESLREEVRARGSQSGSHSEPTI